MEIILFAVIGFVISSVCIPQFLKKQETGMLNLIMAVFYIILAGMCLIMTYAIFVLHIENPDKRMMTPGLLIGFSISWILLLVFYKKLVEKRIIDRRTSAEVLEEYEKSKKEMFVVDGWSPDNADKRMFVMVGKNVKKVIQHHESFVKDTISRKIKEIEKDPKLTTLQKLAKINSMNLEIDKFLDAVEIHGKFSEEQIGKDFMEIIMKSYEEKNN